MHLDNRVCDKHLFDFWLGLFNKCRRLYYWYFFFYIGLFLILFCYYTFFILFYIGYCLLFFFTRFFAILSHFVSNILLLQIKSFLFKIRSCFFLSYTLSLCLFRLCLSFSTLWNFFFTQRIWRLRLNVFLLIGRCQPWISWVIWIAWLKLRMTLITWLNLRVAWIDWFILWHQSFVKVISHNT